MFLSKLNPLVQILSKCTPFIYAAIGFSAVIIVHEFGHFFFCKLFGIGTSTFSVGMGPTIYQRKIGETNFKVSAIPVGGYLEMADENVTNSDTPGPKKNLFSEQPYWKKMLVLLGGILFNLMFAYMTYTAIYLQGMPSARLTHVAIASVMPDSAASDASLKKDDLIVGVGDIVFSTMQKPTLSSFTKAMTAPPGATVNLHILRADKEFNVDATLKGGANDERGMLGITLNAAYAEETEQPQTLLNALKRSGHLVWKQMSNIGSSLKNMVTKRTMQGAGGPLAILSFSVKTAEQGAISLFLFLAFISINLALFNILPLGVVDGGKAMMVTLETIFGRPMPILIQNVVDIASVAFLGGLMLVLTYKDILRIFFS